MTNRRSIADFPRNEAGLVDEFIGTAYDTVYQVYLNLQVILQSPENASIAKASAEAAKASELAAALSANNASASEIAAAEYAAQLAEAVASAIASADTAEQAALSAAASLEAARLYTSNLLPPQATHPTAHMNGDPLVYGDRYFNTVDQAEYLYTVNGWVSNSSLVAIEKLTADLADKSDPTKGASKVGTRFPAQSLLAAAIGRALTDKLYDTVSVKDFVLLGDPVVSDPENADWYPTVQRAFDWAKAYVVGKIRGVDIDFPPGEYHMSKKAKCDLAPAGTANTGAVGIRLTGHGTAQTSFVAMASNIEGCIHLTSGRNMEVFEVRSMSFLSDLDEDAEANNGIALTIDSALKRGDVGYGDQPRWSVVLDDIYVGGYGRNAGYIARRGNWMKGIYIADKYHPKLSNIRCLARYSGVMDARTACTHGVHIHACYSPAMSHMYVHGAWEHGIWVTDLYNVSGGFEDFRLIDSFVAGPDHGVGIIHDNDIPGSSQLTEPGGLISGLHCNSRKMGITIRNHHQVIINGLYAYAPRQERRGNEMLPSCILLDNASDIMISGEFLEPGFYNSNTDAAVAVRIESASECIMIDAQFGHGGIGVLNNSTATVRKTIVVNAKLTTSRRLVALWAPLTLLVDNAGTATLYNNILQNSQDIMEFGSGKPNSATYPAALRARSLVNGNSYGGALELSSTGLDGIVKHLLILRSRMVNTTLGSEESAMNAFILKGGSLSEAFRLAVPTVDNDSYGYLLFRVDEATVSMQRIKRGAANSAITGKRMLMVDN